MATKAKKPQKRRRAKPTFLPDMEPPCIQPIEDAAASYYDVMRERCDLSKQEDHAKDALIVAMAAEGLTYYKTQDGKTVTIVDRKNVKVKKATESNGESEE